MSEGGTSLRAGEEHDVLALLAEEQEERAHLLLTSHLTVAHCAGCGKGVKAVPAHVGAAHCIECGREAAGVAHDAFLGVGQWVAAPDILTRRVAHCVGGFDAAEHARDGSEAVSFPSPKLTLAPVLPKAALSLAEFAREQGWEVRTAGSTGHVPHGTTGRPGALKELISLRFGQHSMTDRHAYAVYSRTASGGTWQWSSVMVWGPGLPPFGGFSITDLRRYLFEVSMSDADVRVWVGDVARAATVKKALLKAKPKAAPKPKEGMS